jgi:hypothetical protein
MLPSASVDSSTCSHLLVGVLQPAPEPGRPLFLALCPPAWLQLLQLLAATKEMLNTIKCEGTVIAKPELLRTGSTSRV